MGIYMYICTDINNVTNLKKCKNAQLHTSNSTEQEKIVYIIPLCYRIVLQ